MAKTITEAAAAWGVSVTTVRKWILQGRLHVQRMGKRGWLILDEDRPAPCAPGSLSETARKRWCYGKKYRPGQPAETPAAAPVSVTPDAGADRAAEG